MSRHTGLSKAWGISFPRVSGDEPFDSCPAHDVT